MGKLVIINVETTIAAQKLRIDPAVKIVLFLNHHVNLALLLDGNAREIN